MDMESGKQLFIKYLKKYQYIILVILIGAFLMLIPHDSEKPTINTPVEKMIVPDLEKELSEILCQISGVGKAAVLLTEASGSNTIYQMDTGQNQSNLDTVIIRDENREEYGLVKQVISPEYRGAIIVCQGGDRADVRLTVINAVKSVTGISSDCITVLKMK